MVVLSPSLKNRPNDKDHKKENRTYHRRATSGTDDLPNNKYKMKTETTITEKAVTTYQCAGCINGSFPDCYKKSSIEGIGCEDHFPATYITSIGKILLGMPKGFTRLGPNESTKLFIIEKFSDFKGYCKYTRPVWKYKNSKGHTMVRVFMPRTNNSLIHLFLEDCIDKIDCLEITEEDINFMD